MRLRFFFPPRSSLFLLLATAHPAHLEGLLNAHCAHKTKTLIILCELLDVAPFCCWYLRLNCRNSALAAVLSRPRYVWNTIFYPSLLWFVARKNIFLFFLSLRQNDRWKSSLQKIISRLLVYQDSNNNDIIINIIHVLFYLQL